MTPSHALRRRCLLGATGVAAAGLFAPGAFAAQLMETAAMSEGPLYPDLPPLDTDNDLLLLNDAIAPAVGEITYLSGRILDRSGAPLRNAFVEIWQCDAKGVYRHSSQSGAMPERADANFQGYGRCLTDSSGGYHFRTIKPVPYDFMGATRAPHIHFAVSRNGRRLLTTQVFIKGHPGNYSDFLLRKIDAADLDSIVIPFEPLAGSQMGELSARFDVVLGLTAEEDDDGVLRGSIAKPVWGS